MSKLTPPAKSGGNSFTSLNSIDGANAGARMTIVDVEGNPTSNWLHVLGMDSQSYQKARRIMRRNIFSVIETKGEEHKKTDEYSEFSIKEQLRLQASLVTEWSFDEKCTIDNLVALFTQAPYVGEQVDEFVSKRSRFAKA